MTRSAQLADKPLQTLARACGIQTTYVDMAGKKQHASADSLQAVLGLWGIDARNEQTIDEAIRLHQQRHWQQPVEPVSVAWDGRPGAVELRLPIEVQPSELYGKVHFEDGRSKALDVSPRSARLTRLVKIEGRTFCVRKLSLPALPLGYHWLELEMRERLYRMLLISAPTRSYAPPEQTAHWGLFAPMYAIESQRSWGAGNFSDWQRLAEWAGALGGNVMASLPLLPAFLGRPVCEPSPYSPASRLFWNEFYLDVPKAPEFEISARARQLVNASAFQKQLETFRRARLVDYPAQASLRRQVLSLLSREFFRKLGTPRFDAFRGYLRARPVLEDYAEFRATCDRTQRPWHNWEERLRHGKLQPDDYELADKQYYLYTQFLAQEQMDALLARGRKDGIQFYLDLPLGIHPDGYDLWRHRDAFAFPASAGAPPDPVFTQGQNWGFAPLHPERLRQSAYSYVLSYLRFQMRHTRMLRIDHIPGLHRLYWIPPGLPPSRGVYVTYPAAELYAIFCLESHRHRTVLAGENLGTVPPEVNDAMELHQIRETYVLQYEQRTDPRRPVRPPLARSVASINTHDMPAFVAHWHGADLDDRAELGLAPKNKLWQEKNQRRKLNDALVKFLRRRGFLKTGQIEPGEVLQASLEWLAASRAETVLITLEDLWLEELPQNVPGTSTERPNWRRKARLSLEEILVSPELRQKLERIQSLRARNRSRSGHGPAAFSE